MIRCLSSPAAANPQWWALLLPKSRQFPDKKSCWINYCFVASSMRICSSCYHTQPRANLLFCFTQPFALQPGAFPDPAFNREITSEVERLLFNLWIPESCCVKYRIQYPSSVPSPSSATLRMCWKWSLLPTSNFKFQALPVPVPAEQVHRPRRTIWPGISNLQTQQHSLLARYLDFKTMLCRTELSMWKREVI